MGRRKEPGMVTDWGEAGRDKDDVSRFQQIKRLLGLKKGEKVQGLGSVGMKTREINH